MEKIIKKWKSIIWILAIFVAVGVGQEVQAADLANGTVLATVIQSDGKILIGGSFTSYNGVTMNRIALLSADGTLDTSFDSGTGANNTVEDIVVQSDGKIVIGGRFTVFNNVARNGVARLNSDGTLDTTFDPGTGASDVISLAIQADEKILVGGLFYTFNGTITNRLARLNSDGSLDTSFIQGTGVNDRIESISIQSDGKIFISGIFTTCNDIAQNHIARLNANGTLDTTFDSGTGPGPYPNAIISSTLQPDGKILIGGYFTNYNGIAINRIARLNSNGSLDTSFSPETGSGGYVTDIAVQSDGKILAGGIFEASTNDYRSYIIRFTSDGEIDDTTFSGSVGTTGSSIEDIAIQANGKIVMGGSFTTYNDIVRNNITRFNADGTPDVNFGAVQTQTPKASPGGSSFSSAQSIILSSETPGAAIYYTIDESAPTTASILYAGEIRLTENTIIKAIAVKDGMENSGMMTEEYNINLPYVDTPRSSPDTGMYSLPQTIILTCETPEAKIYYTIDGAAPTINSILYTDPFIVSQDTQINAIAVKDEMITMDSYWTAYYYITNQVEEPIPSPGEGEYDSPQAVTLTSATPGATIYYATDDSDLTTDSTVYTAPFLISKNTTLRAFAVKSGMEDSYDINEDYIINGTGQASMPHANLPGGVHIGAKEIELSTTTPNAIIHYTLDGTTPTTSSTRYTAPIAISQNTTLKAIAITPELNDSNVMIEIYAITYGVIVDSVGFYQVNDDIGDGIISVDGGMTESSKVIYNYEYTIQTGDVSVTIPIGTEMTKKDGGNFDLTSMASQQFSIDGMAGVLKFGVPNQKMVFSKPISISIKVGTQYDGKTLEVLYQNDGESNWNQETSCLVSGGICQFSTNHATYFAAKDKNSKSSSKSSKKKEVKKVKRAIKNSKKSLQVGETLYESGKRFSKNSDVALYFGKYGGGYFPPKIVKTNASGSFALSYIIPANKQKGSYSWYALDTKTGKKSKVIYFKVK